MLDDRKERNELRSYCRNCTDRQLEQVYADEVDRAERAQDSDVGTVAEWFADEAYTELQRRGLR